MEGRDWRRRPRRSEKWSTLEGRAAAVDGTGARRLLREGARFEAGETLRTLAGSELRLRFDDGALLTLAESSALNLQAYSEVAGVSSLRRSSSRAAFAPRPVQLLERRLVPIGWPHLSRCSGFEARIMPLAWLKSRGTGSGRGVQEGLIALEKSAGSLTLGVNQPFQFARVVSLTAAPQGVAVAPVGLDRYLSLELGPPPAAAGERGIVGGGWIGRAVGRRGFRRRRRWRCGGISSRFCRGGRRRDRRDFRCDRCGCGPGGGNRCFRSGCWGR